MNKDSKYSCFVLHENGSWVQPTFKLPRDMSEEEFSRLVLAHYGRKYFIVLGIDSDEACQDDDFLREFSGLSSQ